MQGVIVAVLLGAVAVVIAGMIPGSSGRLRHAAVGWIAVEVVIELGAFVVVPTGAGGPALRIWALMRGGMPFSTVMVRSVIHAVIFNVPYIGAAVLLGMGVALGLGPGHAPLTVALAPLGIQAVAGVTAVATLTTAGVDSGPPRASS